MPIACLDTPEVTVPRLSPASTGPDLDQRRPELGREPPSNPVLVCMADVQPRQVQWLWPGRVALGRITLVGGFPGLGKSFLTTDMASRVSTGASWPDGSPCPAGSVILISAEDDPSDTIRPRLDAHHADVRRVHLLSAVRRRTKDGRDCEVLFALEDVVALDTALQAHTDCRLVVIDPIGSFLGRRTDAHRDNEVRGVLAPVARLAEKYGPAIVVVSHWNKAWSSVADDLILGSRAFTGIARAVWHLISDVEDKNRQLLLPGKNNLAPGRGGLAFRIQGDPPALVWEPDPVNMSADDALGLKNRAASNKKPGPKPKARDTAAEWLANLLASGPLAAGEVREAAEAAGCSWRTVQRAADTIEVKRTRSEFKGGWIWELTHSEGSAKKPENLSSCHLRESRPEMGISEPITSEDDKSDDSDVWVRAEMQYRRS